MPNGRAGLSPTGTNSSGASRAIRAAHKGAEIGREGAAGARLPTAAISRTIRRAWPRSPSAGRAITEHGSVYRVAGALTITRAATTQREIDALPDPLTIDLSEIERMDTVGAWIVYRTVRDRGAKVIGASRDEVSLLEQVGEFDKPARVVPTNRTVSRAVLRELGEWVAEAARRWSACSASSARP